MGSKTTTSGCKRQKTVESSAFSWYTTSLSIHRCKTWECRVLDSVLIKFETTIWINFTTIHVYSTIQFPHNKDTFRICNCSSISFLGNNGSFTWCDADTRTIFEIGAGLGMTRRAATMVALSSSMTPPSKYPSTTNCWDRYHGVREEMFSLPVQ